MRLLVIGGTRFVGKHVVAAALADGHEVTLLHRRSSDLFPAATHLLADRDGDLSVLADGEWDATVDVCAYHPGQVRSLAAALGGRGGHHLLVSTVSVYADPPGPDATEDAALLPPAGPDVSRVTPETYGPLKVACEAAAAQAYGEQGLAVVRPTLVIGPDDYTGRYPWWVRRMVRGGEVLAPGPADQPIQVVDARDLGAFVVHLVTHGTAGTFNAARPWLHWSELLEATAAPAPAGTGLTWVDAEWLVAQGVTGAQIPFWTEGQKEWSLAVSGVRAEAAGLRHRPLAETVRDTAAWAGDDVLVEGLGLAPDREAELLATWGRARPGPVG
ncbi:MAG TPA: NAD-dependent epimerase/dehydratase family protein [Nocardioides sp.]|uniref:NAD-dependent epimerase/dehydratase family protein n=1 Tax=Nocardioides sp. TaxID=35761 RepID=UPI002BAFA376|nr:NAD-dependent epimerase/dehydratase family protein [Nocardioides sp.]HQR28271.1 NAD-dependent epimerase/dehydratase family protein [Nocardioides sp.]